MHFEGLCDFNALIISKLENDITSSSSPFFVSRDNASYVKCVWVISEMEESSSRPLVFRSVNDGRT
jgi:hypothetical protein